MLLSLAGSAGSGVRLAGEVVATPDPVPTDPEPSPTVRPGPGRSEPGVVDPPSLANARAEIRRSSTVPVRVEERIGRSGGYESTRRHFEGTVANGPADRTQGP